MESKIRTILTDAGVYESYKDRLEEVDYVLLHWWKRGMSFSAFIFALENNTPLMQKLLKEARVGKIETKDMENKE